MISFYSQVIHSPFITDWYICSSKNGGGGEPLTTTVLLLSDIFLYLKLNKETMISISKNQFYIYFALCCLILFLCLRGDRWFPILDSANLAFHEFGHPFFGFFSERLMVYGGTLGQLIFPCAFCIKFYRDEKIFSASIALLWLFENFFNIATYMRDARAQALSLVGGGEHDWTEILTRWGVLENDIRLSNALIWITVLAMLSLGYWLYTKLDR